MFLWLFHTKPFSQKRGHLGSIPAPSRQLSVENDYIRSSALVALVFFCRTVEKGNLGIPTRISYPPDSDRYEIRVGIYHSGEGTLGLQGLSGKGRREKREQREERREKREERAERRGEKRKERREKREERRAPPHPL